LFPAPDAALGEWRARFGRCLREHEDAHTSAVHTLQAQPLSPATRCRLTHWADAQREQIRLLRDVLQPMLGDAPSGPAEAYMALRTRLPPEQGLVTYSANLHRDWAWGEVENVAALECVQNVLDRRTTKHLLVLGAGASRLAYDLHRALGATHTVALDVNPLLMYAAAQIVDGDAIELFEFPLAPRSAADCAVRRTLRAPGPLKVGFHPTLADGRCPPLRAGAFDLVVTPWYVDIVQEDVATTLRRVNRLLAPSGRWVTFGSLAFARPDARDRWSLDELIECAEANGFTRPHSTETEMDYLCSPASRHGRRECVVTMCAEKSADASAPPQLEALPDWIVGGRTAVPLLPTFQRQIATTRIHAFIMSLIDGRRSLGDIAAVLEQQQLLPRAEAEGALRGFLTTMLDESRGTRGL
jgi:hypothetical protein